MRNYLYLVILGFIVLTACTNNGENNVKGEVDIHGYVLDKIEDSIFVVSKDSKDLSANGGITDYYDAIRLSDAPKNVQVGDEVMVWYSGEVAESYPMIGTVGQIEIVPDSKPEGAILTAAEGLKEALKVQKNVVVTSINFNEETSIWLIQFRDLHEDNTWQVEVKDSK